MKKLLVSLAALIVLALPGAAYADTITFWAPITAPDSQDGSGGSNPGGNQQFDLDHHRAYTWQLNNVVRPCGNGVTTNCLPAGHSITGAKLTFRSITNWDLNPNTLFVHMLDSANSFATANGNRSATVNGVTWVTDAEGVPVTTISDYFAGANVLESGGDTFLGQFSDCLTAGCVNQTQNFVLTFNEAQLSALMMYLASGNNLAFGFDPDCHFWNDGIKFEITTGPQAVPEPTTMALLGTGLAGVYYRRRRQRKQ